MFLQPEPKQRKVETETKKILVWNEEKKAFVLENMDVSVGESDDYRLVYYGEMIPWSSDQFDDVFMLEARLHGYACVLSNQVRKIRRILDDVELVREKLERMEKEMVKKKYMEGIEDEKPF